jgi:NADPH:quinone reductase-like Zn-dependent oxidoreductase
MTHTNSIIIPEKATCAVIRSFGGPEVLQIEQLPVPEIGDNQLLIKVKAVSINPIDWKQRKGNHRFILGAPFPIVPGYDVSGVVAKVGAEIENFKVGDEVFGVLDNKYGGAYGQFAKGTERCFVHKPLNITFEQAAAVSLAALTALQALRDKASLKRNDTLVVNGAGGGVGHFALQIGKLLGAKVIAVSSERSRKFVESFKPDEHIDYNRSRWWKKTEKVDVFFDVAGMLSFTKVLGKLNRGGSYVNTLPRPKILLHKLLQPFVGRKVHTMLMQQRADDLILLSQWLANEQLKVHVDKVFELKDVQDAHRYAQSGRVQGKIVITIPQ